LDEAEAVAKARAQPLFEKGVSAYRESRFYDAVDIFLETNRRYPDPKLSFNVGKAFEGFGNQRVPCACGAAGAGSSPSRALDFESACSLESGNVSRKLGANQLERDMNIERNVLRPPHRLHPAFTQDPN